MGPQAQLVAPLLAPARTDLRVPSSSPPPPPQPQARQQACSASHPCLLVRICSLFRSATPAHCIPACQDSWASVASLSGGGGKQQREGHDWAGRGPDGSAARLQHPARPSKYSSGSSTKEPGEIVHK